MGEIKVNVKKNFRSLEAANISRGNKNILFIGILINVQLFFFRQQTAILLLKHEVVWVTRPE